MKDKDPNDEELNKDEQDNINEADDSFGLPDLDFNTLDEESEEEIQSEEEPADTENVEETDDSAEEEPQPEVSEPDDEEAEEEEVAPVRTSYVPPKPESNTPKVVGVIVAILLVATAIWYFGFYRPQVAAEKARIEAAAKLKADAAAKAAAEQRAEEQRLAAEQAVNVAADADELASEEPTFTTISERTGRYYIVIESFVDSDMAADYGNELVTKGFSTALLSPQGKRKFHRLTMGDFDSFVNAQEGANTLKAEFGDDLWVLKY